MTDTSEPITALQLDELRELIESRSGVLFDVSRERFFIGHIRDHLAEKNCNGGELLRAIRASNTEYDGLLERLLTQETSFYRYPGGFPGAAEAGAAGSPGTEVLGQSEVAADLERRLFHRRRTLFDRHLGGGRSGIPEAWEIEILATDISMRALKRAEEGVYSGRSLENLSPQQIESYFFCTQRGYSVKPRIRRMISFAPMNLAQSVYVGKLDCIFCMNVLMYFSEERRNSA